MIAILANNEEMKNIITSLQSHGEQWTLAANNSKTKAAVFSRGVETARYDFKFKEDNIKAIKEYKHLGVTFYCNGRLRNGQLGLKAQAVYSLTGKMSQI